MHTTVLGAEALALLKELAAEPEFSGYRLVGGTSLALQRGHRRSIDLDFFLVGKGHPPEIELVLREKYRAHKYAAASAGRIVTCFMRAVKVDLVSYPYPWLDTALMWEGVSLASPKDISAMKISAIGQRGSKKDFFDLAELLKIYRLEDIINFFMQKYPSANNLHYLQSLTHFADAEEDLQPELLAGAPSWDAVKLLLQKEVSRMLLP